jgi:hypothetical protein
MNQPFEDHKGLMEAMAKLSAEKHTPLVKEHAALVALLLPSLPVVVIDAHMTELVEYGDD